jgi:hypothetical protein
MTDTRDPLPTLLAVMREARDMGYTEVEADVTRGGTMRIKVKVGDGAKVAGHQYQTGRAR